MEKELEALQFLARLIETMNLPFQQHVKAKEAQQLIEKALKEKGDG